MNQDQQKTVKSNRKAEQQTVKTDLKEKDVVLEKINQKEKNIKEIVLEPDDFTLEKENNRFVTKKAKAFQAEFASEMNREETVRIKKDNHLLSMSYKGKRGKGKKGNQAKGKIEKNKAIYTEIEEGIDLEYQCLSHRIKENLIIRQRQEDYDFDFTLQIGDLTPVFNEEESTLELQKEGKTVYKILSPYMEDAEGNRSEDCSYHIEQNGNELTLQLHCDEEWINEKGRIFPVTVDPTIEIVEQEAIRYIGIKNGEEYDAGLNIPVGVIVSESPVYYALKIQIDMEKLFKNLSNIQWIKTLILRFIITNPFLHFDSNFYVINEQKVINEFTMHNQYYFCFNYCSYFTVDFYCRDTIGKIYQFEN